MSQRACYEYAGKQSKGCNSLISWKFTDRLERQIIVRKLFFSFFFTMQYLQDTIHSSIFSVNAKIEGRGEGDQWNVSWKE